MLSTQSPDPIGTITPQPQESGYWTKVLTNTFGLAGSESGVFLRGRLGLAGFSAIAAIAEYASEIWNVERCPVRQKHGL
jgi:hypothetical protein